MTANTDSADGADFLDEEDEQYGWGILNVHRNQFCTPLGHGTQEGTDSDIFTDRDSALDYFEVLDNQQMSMSHLRIVRVQLDNEADREAFERTQ